MTERVVFTLEQVEAAFRRAYQPGSHFFSGSRDDRNYRWGEFLYELQRAPCVLTCHDDNHNGDTHLDQGCGNPNCWKHRIGNSPPPKWMTFEDARCTCTDDDRMRYEKLANPLG